MVNRDLVASKLADLALRVERVRLRCPATADQLASDPDALDIVSFSLMLAVQICADIASHLVADEEWPVARTLAEGFHRMRDHGVIAAPTAEALCRAVGLRNVVLHGYSGVNPAMVHAAATAGLADLEGFAQQVSAWITRS